MIYAIRLFMRQYRRTFSNAASLMLAYRSNLLFFFVFETLFLLSSFLSVSVGFDFAGGSIAGWTRDEAYLLAAISGMSHQLFICFMINPLFLASSEVWTGKYDYVLLKPLGLFRAMILTADVAVSNIPNALINAVLLVVFMARADILTFSHGLLMIFFVIASLLTRCALALLLVAPTFFAERMSEGESAFWSIQGIGRYPTSIFPRVLEMIFTFVLPLGMLASIPASALYGKESPTYYLYAILAAGIFLFIAVQFYRFAAKQYKSVNSGI